MQKIVGLLLVVALMVIGAGAVFAHPDPDHEVELPEGKCWEFVELGDNHDLGYSSTFWAWRQGPCPRPTPTPTPTPEPVVLDASPQMTGWRQEAVRHCEGEGGDCHTYYRLVEYHWAE